MAIGKINDKKYTLEEIAYNFGVSASDLKTKLKLEKDEITFAEYIVAINSFGGKIKDVTENALDFSKKLDAYSKLMGLDAPVIKKKADTSAADDKNKTTSDTAAEKE